MKNISISEKRLKKIFMLIILSTCLCIAIFVILWANEPEQRPLIQNIQIVDTVKIIDALEISEIPYTLLLSSKMILVNVDDMDQARLALARVGYVVDYPDVREMANSNEACRSLEATLKEQAQETIANKPVFEQIWFIKALKLMMGALVIMVLIVSVLRPAVRSLIDSNLDDDVEP